VPPDIWQSVPHTWSFGSKNFCFFFGDVGRVTLQGHLTLSEAKNHVIEKHTQNVKPWLHVK